MNGEGARMSNQTMRQSLSEVYEWHMAEGRTSEEQADLATEQAVQLMMHLGFDPMTGVLDDFEEGPEISIVNELLTMVARRLPTQVEHLLDVLNSLPSPRELFQQAVEFAVREYAECYADNKRSGNDWHNAREQVRARFAVFGAHADRVWADRWLDQRLREAVVDGKVREAQAYLNLHNMVTGIE